MLKKSLLKLHHSVHAKIVIAVVFTVLTVGLVYNGLIAQMKDAWRKDWVDRQAEMLAVVLHNHLRHGANVPSQSEMQRSLHFLKLQSGAKRIQVLDDAKVVLYSSTGENGENDEFDSLFHVIQPLELSWCPECRESPPSTPSGFLYYEADLNDLPIRFERENSLMEWFSLLAVILTTVVVLIVVHVVVKRPLTKLTTAIEELKKGKDDYEPPKMVQDEFGQLSKQFEGLLQSLEAKKSELSLLYQVHMEEASRLANIGELASGLAHEIKTPLHGVISAMQVIIRRDPDNANIHIFNQMQHQLQRVVKLLDDMLAFARPKKPMFDSCELNQILDRVLALVHADSEKAGVSIHRKENDSIPMLRLDSEKMEQVFLNLILNALQSCERGGNVTVSTETEKGMVVIRVQDDGPGVPKDIAERIFEPFFTTKEKGTGLGLSITSTIIEQHGGTITLKDCDKGTCFEIRLPELQPKYDTPGNDDDVMMTTTSILDTYILGLTCSCDKADDGKCPNDILRTLGSMDMESRKKVLSTLSNQEKLRIQREHINCPLDGKK